jgi:hypothetical protein
MLAARFRWYWPYEIIVKVVEWVVNAMGFTMEHGNEKSPPYRFIEPSTPVAKRDD